MLFCQVEVYATDRTLIQRNPTERGVPDCDLYLNLNSEVTYERIGLLPHIKVNNLHNTTHNERTIMTSKKINIAKNFTYTAPANKKNP
jgi:hypothetical protein